MSETPEIPYETVELATIAWYEATPGVSWAGAGKYERAAMLTRTKIILMAALPHLRVHETLGAKAGAWEEGWRRGVRDANRPESLSTNNPYREAADRA